MIQPISPIYVPSDSEERRAWALFHLRCLRIKLRDLADREGVSYSALHAAFTKRSIPMERVLAEALGMKPHELFPERYQADGTPQPIKRPRNKKLING